MHMIFLPEGRCGCTTYHYSICRKTT